MPLKILKRVGDNNYKFQPFQEDLGAPLIQYDVIVGILARVQENLQQSILFVDLSKSRNEIDNLLNDDSKFYKNSPLRKKARYDCLTFCNKRARKSTLEETNHEESSYEETNHDENNQKRLRRKFRTIIP